MSREGKTTQKQTVMPNISLKGVNWRLWSHLGASNWKKDVNTLQAIISFSNLHASIISVRIQLQENLLTRIDFKSDVFAVVLHRLRLHCFQITHKSWQSSLSLHFDMASYLPLFFLLYQFISSTHREQSTKWESSYYLDRYLCPCTGRSTIWWVMNSLLSSNVAPNASALCHETSPPKHLVNKTAQFTLWTISKSRNCTLWGIFGLRRKTFFRPQKNVSVGDLELLRQWLKTADKIRSP